MPLFLLLSIFIYEFIVFLNFALFCCYLHLRSLQLLTWTRIHLLHWYVCPSVCRATVGLIGTRMENEWADETADELCWISAFTRILQLLSGNILPTISVFFFFFVLFVFVVVVAVVINFYALRLVSHETVVHRNAREEWNEMKLNPIKSINSKCAFYTQRNYHCCWIFLFYLLLLCGLPRLRLHISLVTLVTRQSRIYTRICAGGKQVCVSNAITSEHTYIYIQW